MSLQTLTASRPRDYWYNTGSGWRAIRWLLLCASMAISLLSAATQADRQTAQQSPMVPPVVASAETDPQPTMQVSPVPETTSLLNETIEASPTVNYPLLLLVVVILHLPIFFGLIVAIAVCMPLAVKRYSMMVDATIPNPLALPTNTTNK